MKTFRFSVVIWGVGLTFCIISKPNFRLFLYTIRLIFVDRTQKYLSDKVPHPTFSFPFNIFQIFKEVPVVKATG